MRCNFFRFAVLATFVCSFFSVQANELSIHPLGEKGATKQHNERIKTTLKSTSTSDDTDLWERIRRGFGIPDLENNPLVQSQIAAHAKPKYVNRVLTRASRYLHYIVEEIEARGMPTEIALLPVIESAFNPDARSHAKAVGMWQFIPSTGKHFNLKQSALMDERKNVTASTEAALEYLQKLYGMFGDWQLALAAYNWGEGSVQRALRKNQERNLPTDFNSLSARMPKETRHYVPKLQAVKTIIAQPEKYNLTLPKVENQPSFVSIQKTCDIDVPIAAKLAEMPLDEFCALNPQFGKHVITGDEDTQILLPPDKAKKFETNLASWQKSGRPLSSWTTYQVTEGKESVGEIAQKFDTSPSLISEANRLPSSAKVKVGSTLLVPKKLLTDDDEHEDIDPDVMETAQIHIDHPQYAGNSARSKRIFISIGRKDTVASIAKRYKISKKEALRLSKMKGKKVAVYLPTKSAAKSRTKITAKSSKQEKYARNSKKQSGVKLAQNKKKNAKNSDKKSGKKTVVLQKGKLIVKQRIANKKNKGKKL